MPALLAGAERKPFQQGSGRLELARAIASPSNPLTARVMVNRVWLGHFGRGIVNTPSDFGTRGEAPTHPELLDWLSCYFMGQGNPSNSASYTPQRRAWSLKGLHRLILLSAAYQQDSEDRVLERAVDPENRLLWKMSRRRLDFEALHDTLLAAGGRLDLRMGGPAVDLAGSGATRRAVYGLIDRQRPSAFFRTFDFPAPDRSTPQRYATTSPQQALFLMNSAFAETCARALGDRSGGPGTRSAERVRRLYTLLFQRLPTDQELQLGLKFLETTPGKKTAARRYAQALQMTNELVFAD
jgi:hypothetical protein